MEYTVKAVLLVLGCLSSCVSMVVSYDTGCIGELCFTLFDYSNNFMDAKILCQNNASSSNLISITDDETRDAAWQFLNQSNASSSDFIYIDTMLQKANERTWYLINGSKYWGGVSSPQNWDIYWLYGYISRYGQSSLVHSSRPDQRFYFICQLNTTACSNNSNAILYKEQCYVKNEKETVTWYEARKRCLSNGGDLARFNYPSKSYDNYSPPFDTSLLIPNFSYWFGLRFYNWSWISPSDGNSETLYDGWSFGKPSNLEYSCVCIDPKGSPKWSWTDCDCSIRRPFLCVKKVPTTTSTTPATTAKATVTTAASPNNNSSQDATANLSSEQKLIIGLVVGLGGSLLIIFIVVIIIIIIRCRKRNRDVNSTSSSDELQTENHKNQRAGILNNSLSAEDVDGSQYAAVVVNAPPQKKTESSETRPEVLYTSFDHGRNKPSDSDETDGRMASRQARETIYAPSADEVYANAQQ